MQTGKIARALVAQSSEKDLSAAQRKFLTEMPPGRRRVLIRWIDHRLRRIPERSSRRLVRHRSDLTLVAVSAEDAQRLAIRILAAVQADRKERFEAVRTFAMRRIRELPKLRQALQQAEARLGRATATAEDLNARVPWETVAAAEEEAKQLEALLRRLAIDIAGIEAKLAAIAKLQERPPDPSLNWHDDDARLFFERLRIEQDIVLAGALAQRAAADKQVTLARQFVDAREALDRAKLECGEAVRTLARVERQIAERLEDFAALAAGGQPEHFKGPYSLVDNEIIIRPAVIEGSDERPETQPAAGE